VKEEPTCEICDQPFSKCAKRDWHAHQTKIRDAARARTRAAEKRVHEALTPEERREDYTNSQAHRKRNEWLF
jgi:hypothetical protein